MRTATDPPQTLVLDTSQLVTRVVKTSGATEVFKSMFAMSANVDKTMTKTTKRFAATDPCISNAASVLPTVLPLSCTHVYHRTFREYRPR